MNRKIIIGNGSLEYSLKKIVPIQLSVQHDVSPSCVACNHFGCSQKEKRRRLRATPPPIQPQKKKLSSGIKTHRA